MTADTRQLTVGHLQPLMKLIQVGRLSRVRVRLANTVARKAFQGDWLTVGVQGSGWNAQWNRWPSNDHGVQLGGHRTQRCSRWTRFCSRLLTPTSPREASQQAGCGNEATREDQRTVHGDRQVLNKVSQGRAMEPAGDRTMRSLSTSDLVIKKRSSVILDIASNGRYPPCVESPQTRVQACGSAVLS